MSLTSEFEIQAKSFMRNDCRPVVLKGNFFNNIYAQPILDIFLPYNKVLQINSKTRGLLHYLSVILN